MKENINTLIENQNAFIKKWTYDMSRKQLPSSVRSAGIKASNASRPFDLKPSFHTEKKGGVGTIKRIGFRMSKVGVWQEKGVGRGRKIRSGKETPKPWFGPAVDKNIQELADGLALITGSTISKAIRIR